MARLLAFLRTRHLSVLIFPLLSACSSTSTAPLGSYVWHFFSSDTPSSEYISNHMSPSVVVKSTDNANNFYLLALRSAENTYWQSSKNTAFMLHNERLASTGGFKHELLSTRYLYDGIPPWQRSLDELPAYYQVEAYYQDMLYQASKGKATLRCKSTPEHVNLPLTNMLLTPCIEKIEWANGENTYNYLWREPRTSHIRQAEETPWPGAPTFIWKAAKPW
ncbi:YjbF family lipoprotein [Phytohalomonas tamaricis]|uniref:YjbF family lipoprotein n=1 Tax=Phytohalomonas tamaricis TaxID=2081032 RepID=UPI000D0AEF9C|nr:YjbF family lipoprotein [Phytohalomonas tamaricis]